MISGEQIVVTSSKCYRLNGDYQLTLSIHGACWLYQVGVAEINWKMKGFRNK